jgi:hypothetical protein
MRGVSVRGVLVTYIRSIFKTKSGERCKNSCGNRTSPAIRNASDGERAVPDSRDDVSRHESQPRTRENIQRLERELRIVNKEILEFETRLQRLAQF